MNYPMQSLAIIAPIMFIVLMIVAPLIGVLAGWKRAAYWGGGTFFFFIVGVIIWKTAGTAISGGGLLNLINDLLKGLGVTATTKLVASLAAPVFFLLVMMVAELLLLINYYAWFKRVTGIKADIRAKKYAKAVAKGNKEKMAKYNAYAKPQGWTQMQMTTKGQVINMACGGAGLALLLAPSSVTFTQAIMYTTTSASTRANNQFCSGLYNSLENTASVFSWMSYYGKADTGKDFDSLFSTLALSNQNITYLDPITGEEKSKTAIEAIGDSAANGIKNVVDKAISTSSQGSQNQLDAISVAVGGFADSWNSIINQTGDNVSAVFQSSNVTEMFESILPSIIGDGQITIDAQQVVDAYGEGSVFKNILKQVTDGYASGQETIHVSYVSTKAGEEGQTIEADIKALKSVAVPQEAFNNIKDAFKSVINTDAFAGDATKQAIFDEALTDVLSMMFYVA